MSFHIINKLYGIPTWTWHLVGSDQMDDDNVVAPHS